MTKMDLAASQNQATSMEAMCQAQEQAQSQLNRAIEQFLADTASLKGQAFDSSRSYHASVLLPLAQGQETATGVLKSAARKLPTEYIERVDSKSWSEEELNQKIQEAQASIMDLENQNKALRSSSMPAQASKSQISYHNKLIATHQADKAIYEELLAKLKAFDAYSATILEDYYQLKNTIQTGLAAAKNAWDGKTKTFKLPKDMNWSKELTDKYKVHQVEQVYKQNLQIQYGFDEDTAEQVVQVKKGIDKKFPKLSQQEKDYLLLRILGSASYGIGLKDKMQWDGTAGDLRHYFVKSEVYGNYKEDMTFQEMLVALGLDAKDVEHLYGRLVLQHGISGEIQNITKFNETKKSEYAAEIVSKYKSEKGIELSQEEVLTAMNKMYHQADFTHQSITMSTHLYEGIRPADALGVLRGYGAGASQHVNNLSGWLGDTTKRAGNNISIGVDDYKADLDSVNITSRMKKANQSYLEASNSYYKGVTEYKTNPQSPDAVNRAKEFTENISTEQIYDELVKALPVEKRFNFSEEDLKRLNPVGYQFIKDLESGVTGDE